MMVVLRMVIVMTVMMAVVMPMIMVVSVIVSFLVVVVRHALLLSGADSPPRRAKGQSDRQ
jgi:hypothetical protein